MSVLTELKEVDVKLIVDQFEHHPRGQNLLQILSQKFLLALQLEQFLCQRHEPVLKFGQFVFAQLQLHRLC